MLIGALTSCSGDGGPTDATGANSDVRLTTTDSRATPDKETTTAQDVPRIGDSRWVKPDVDLPTGFMEFCLDDTDCVEWGLTCISEGPADQESVCSQQCLANSDCPEKMLCKKKGESKVCLLASYCDLCDNDEQCGPDGRCIEDKHGITFCSYPCGKDDPESCEAGNFCNKVGAGIEDYYCYPMFGSCKGDGSHCTPCQTDDDCLKGHNCHENPYTFERYCAKVCATKIDCPKGFGCEELPGEDYPLCTLEVEGEAIETCYKGNKSFCEPCMKDYECQSGICYNYPVANKYFCSFPCDEDQWAPEGCPTALFCVPNHGESGGETCVPSTGFGCQGFLNCVAVECAKGEKCLDGFCVPK